MTTTYQIKIQAFNNDNNNAENNNNNKILGPSTWIDFTPYAEEDVDDQIDNFFDNFDYKYKKYQIIDQKGFGNINFKSNESISEIIELVEHIEENDNLDILEGVFEQYSTDINEVIDAIENKYQGRWNSLGEWAENLLDDTGELNTLSSHLQLYFDYESYARDCELGGDIFSIITGYNNIHVFWCN